MRHPAILVDVDRQLRMPVVAFRPLQFGEAGSVGWLRSGDATLPTLIARDDGSCALSGATGDGSEARVEVGHQFHVGMRSYVLERGDDLVVDARRVRDVVILNAWYARRRATSWRGFRVGSPTRELRDIAVTGGHAHVLAPSYGVPLAVLAAHTESQGAVVDDAVAAAIVDPLSRDPLLSASDLGVTWDGESFDMTLRLATSFENLAHGEAERTFLKLVGRAAIDPGAPRAGRGRNRESADDRRERERTMLRTMKRASEPEIADVIRALFPREWAIEEAVREQAALLDVDALPWLDDR